MINFLNDYLFADYFLIGFNPCWKETIEFRLRQPELDLLVISVRDKEPLTEDDLVGLRVIPIKSLKSGMHRRDVLTELQVNIYNRL